MKALTDHYDAEAVPADVEPRVRVLLVHNKLTPFVRIDRDMLRTCYDVRELAISGRWAPPLELWRGVRSCDVVYCWFASMHSLAPALLGRLLRRHVVVVIGGYDTSNLPEIAYGHQRGGIEKYVARATMKLATALVANSRYAAAEAVREAGAASGKISVVYHGLAVDDGSAMAAMDRDGDLVLTVGNVDRPNLRRKGLEPFVRAAALLPHRRFVLVGAWLDDAVDDLRVIAPDNVTLTGHLSDADLQALFRRATVYVQASMHEGFGLALAEAMAAGCTPVVTRAGALPEVVGETGVYVESTHPVTLAAAIERALTVDVGLGEAARERIASRFTLETRLLGLVTVIDAARHPRMKRSLGGPRASIESVGTSVAIEAIRQPEIKMEREEPLVSVIIPVRDEENSIVACLEAVLRQEYPARLVEILVVDGRSTDRTRALVAAIAAADPSMCVRLLDNPGGIASTALNIGIRAARGKIIARVDGHTIIAPNYIRQCVDVLAETGADNVGGLMRPCGTGYIGTCIALATTSRFGVGNSRFHYNERGGEVETVYLGCFRRSIFERAGLFDEGLERNQDDEFNDRIVATGGKIWLSPHIRSTYFNRGSLRALWRQYYQYGYWKVRVLRRHPKALRVRHLVPAVLVASLGGSAMLTILGALLSSSRDGKRRTRHVTFLLVGGAWGTYGGTTVVAAIVIAARRGWRFLPGVLASLWALHVGYGAGFLAGLFRAPALDRPRIPVLPPRPGQDNPYEAHNSP